MPDAVGPVRVAEGSAADEPDELVLLAGASGAEDELGLGGGVTGVFNRKVVLLRPEWGELHRRSLRRVGTLILILLCCIL
jgi:hypothetical protein